MFREDRYLLIFVDIDYDIGKSCIFEILSPDFNSKYKI